MCIDRAHHLAISRFMQIRPIRIMSVEKMSHPWAEAFMGVGVFVNVEKDSKRYVVPCLRSSTKCCLHPVVVTVRGAVWADEMKPSSCIASSERLRRRIHVNVLAHPCDHVCIGHGLPASHKTALLIKAQISGQIIVEVEMYVGIIKPRRIRHICRIVSAVAVDIRISSNHPSRVLAHPGAGRRVVNPVESDHIARRRVGRQSREPKQKIHRRICLALQVPEGIVNAVVYDARRAGLRVALPRSQTVPSLLVSENSTLPGWVRLLTCSPARIWSTAGPER